MFDQKNTRSRTREKKNSKSSGNAEERNEEDDNVKEKDDKGEDESADVRESTLSPRVNDIIYSIAMVDTNQLPSPIYRLSPSLHPSSVPRNSTYLE